MPRPFEWICEIEPPTRPDLMHGRHQIGVLSKVARAFDGVHFIPGVRYREAAALLEGRPGDR